MINGKSVVKNIRFLPILVLLLWGGVGYASDWTLAASPFGFSQVGTKTSVQEKTAKILPQMILEQMGSGERRIPPRDEMLDRKLSSLRKERQSLFLQLSSAVKTRDSLLLQEYDKKKLQKKISQAEKNIEDIQKKIDQNILDVEKSIQQIEDENNKPEKETHNNFFQSFANIFRDEEQKLVEDSLPEQVRIYKNDSSFLLEPGQALLSKGMDSIDVIKFMEDEKINGYLTGNLSFYGNYFSVTIDLHIYPGGKSVGQIMEVGALDNMVQVSRNLSQYLKTIVVNTAPVQIYFDIVPEEAQKDAVIKIDGIVSSLSGKGVSISSGVHTINVECKGYESLATTYDFKDSSHFFIHVPMNKEQSGQFNIGLKNPVDAELFVQGKKIGNGLEGGSVTINGTPIIGLVRQKIPGAVSYDDEGNPQVQPDKILGAFFYVPANLQNDGAFLNVDATPIDLAGLIDNRRKWAYRGYTALIMTLPLTMFTAGNYQTAVNGYMSGYVDYDTAKGWEIARGVSIGLTIAAGGFFIYELVRYLHSASSVLPKTAKEVSGEDFYGNIIFVEKQSPETNEIPSQDNIDGIIEENDLDHLEKSP